MKIDGSHTRGALGDVGKAARARDGRGAEGATSGREGSAVKVSVSTRARRLAEARGPEQPDEARIQRLRDAIEKGTLDVDPARIADAMLREER